MTYTVPASTTVSPQVNTATVSATTSDPASLNNSASDSNAVLASADLSITKTGPTDVTAGETITYTVTVTNDGPSDAQNARVVDLLSAGLSNATVAIGAAPAVAFSNPVSLGTLAADGVVVLTITADVDANVADGTILLNKARTSSTTTDPDMSNNESSPVVSTLVHTSADVADVKIADVGVVFAGNSVTYTITVTNDGPSDAQSVVVSDDLDAYLIGEVYLEAARRMKVDPAKCIVFEDSDAMTSASSAALSTTSPAAVGSSGTANIAARASGVSE